MNNISTTEFLIDSFGPEIVEKSVDSLIARLFSTAVKENAPHPENTTLKDRHISFLDSAYDACACFLKALKDRISDLFVWVTMTLLSWDADEMSESIVDGVFNPISEPEIKTANPAKISLKTARRNYLDAINILIATELLSMKPELADALTSGISAEEWFMKKTQELENLDTLESAVLFLVYAKAVSMAYPDDSSIKNLLKIANDSLKLIIQKEFIVDSI